MRQPPLLTRVTLPIARLLALPLPSKGGTISVTVDPPGRYVYATGDTDDTLAVFTRDPDGSLEFVQVMNRATPGPLLDGVRGSTMIVKPTPVG